MTSGQISLGIVAPSAEVRQLLNTQLGHTGMVFRVIEVDQYCVGRSDSSTRRLLSVSPEVVLIDLEDVAAGLQTVRVLQAALPDAWLLVMAGSLDSQFLIETMRAGARDLLTKPVTARALTQAFSRFLTERQRPQQETASGAIHCVTTAKGGSGATSVCINLASALSTIQDRPVAFIDLNSPIGDAAAYLNLKAQFCVSDALAAAGRLDAVLLGSFMAKSGSFFVLPGLKEYSHGDAMDLEGLGKVLSVAGQAYAHIIVDLPSWIDRRAFHVVSDMAEKILVVLTPELPALWRTDRLLKFIGKNGGKDKVRLLLNRVHKKDEITEQEVTNALRHQVYWTLPNNYAAAIQSINMGVPLVSTNHSELARSYRELAADLIGHPLQEKSTLFSMFKR